MGDLLGLLVAVVLIGAGVAGVAWAFSRITDARGRRLRRLAADGERRAQWEVTQRSQITPADPGGVTQVLVRLVDPDGAEMNRIVVDSVPNDAPDWRERILDARANAADRADLLNAEL